MGATQRKKNEDVYIIFHKAKSIECRNRELSFFLKILSDMANENRQCTMLYYLMKDEQMSKNIYDWHPLVTEKVKNTGSPLALFQCLPTPRSGWAVRRATVTNKGEKGG